MPPKPKRHAAPRSPRGRPTAPTPSDALPCDRVSSRICSCGFASTVAITTSRPSVASPPARAGASAVASDMVRVPWSLITADLGAGKAWAQACKPAAVERHCTRQYVERKLYHCVGAYTTTLSEVGLVERRDAVAPTVCLVCLVARRRTHCAGVATGTTQQRLAHDRLRTTHICHRIVTSRAGWGVAVAGEPTHLTHHAHSNPAQR